jgi:chemotaxis protein methyltransferase CheR
MLERKSSIILSENVFRLLRDLISDYCGIYFDDDSRITIERRLNRRLALRGFDNFRDYYRFLLYDKERDTELSEIIDIITVNETYFFREEKQFKAMIEEILPEMRSSMTDNRKLRIWSAGCASGEEPYSIAMLALENRHVLGGTEIEIIGSDINRRVLEKARRGVYTKNSFRSMDEYFKRRYFDREGDDYRIRDSVRELVSFSHVNLLDTFRQSFIGAVDIVFCRNVLIYFNHESKKRVIEGFAARLRDGGYLMLGHAESLMNVSTEFTLKHLKNDLVYQKPKKSSVMLSNESLYNMLWGGENE